MSAADVPDSDQHAGYMQMARVLVTYLDDPTVIRQAIRREFRSAPTEATIRSLRAKHLERLERPSEAPLKPHDGYYPGDASDALTKTNLLFLAALKVERDLSEQRALTNLRSSYLTQPDLVNRKWEKAMAG